MKWLNKITRQPKLTKSGVRSRIDDLEVLRALSVLGIIVHHLQGNLYADGLPALDALFQHFDFWYGVDLFFAISGFIIARTFLPGLLAQAGNFRMMARTAIAFWIRRIWRLLPSAWLWLFLILMASIFFNSTGAFGPVHANLMATLAGMFDVANFRFADAFFNYPYGASFVYWTLSLEEQFYFLLPLAALFLRRRLFLILLGLFIFQVVVPRTILMMAIRTDALSIAVLLAIFWDTRIYHLLEPRWLLKLKWARVLLPILVVAGMAHLSSVDMRGVWPVGYRVNLMAVGCGILVWLASFNKNYVLPAGWLQKALVWAGLRSYAIYLIHIPAFYAVRELGYRLGLGQTFSIPPWLLAVVAVALIFVLAELNFRFVETPLRRRGRRIAKRYLERGHAKQGSKAVGTST